MIIDTMISCSGGSPRCACRVKGKRSRCVSKWPPLTPCSRSRFRPTVNHADDYLHLDELAPDNPPSLRPGKRGNCWEEKEVAGLVIDGVGGSMTTALRREASRAHACIGLTEAAVKSDRPEPPIPPVLAAYLSLHAVDFPTSHL